MGIDPGSANPTVDGGDGAPEDGIGLCLSGGGYRAMLFHVGTFWRLHEAGRLAGVARISSVSGGSIAAGVLALAWPKLSFAPDDLAPLVEHVVAPLRGLADTTIDVGAIAGGLALPGSIADRVAAAYRRHLFGDATLQDLPDAPRFVLNATSLQTGALWRFAKPYMADYRIGVIDRPTVPLATAVAASSAFPPVLSPLTLPLNRAAIRRDGADVAGDGFLDRAVLCDGGVYDNLGLETVWKNFRTVLVSDAGAKVAAVADPHGDWARGGMRVFDLVDNQVRSLRKRQLLASFRALTDAAEHRAGAFWSIRADLADYPVTSGLPCPPERTAALAATPTRLARLEADVQERLINWGYAICDAALRSHVDPAIPPAKGFPYPGGV